MSCLLKLRAFLVASVVPAAAILMPKDAEAYPIDCAILLCMAGGFPASAECSAAKTEMIRRITPWPIEPPLQLWRCPMGISAEDAAVAGISVPHLGLDGLPPEVRAYRDGIEIYHVRYTRVTSGDDNGSVQDDTVEGRYDREGNFSWVNSSFIEGPSWLSQIPGATRRTIIDDETPAYRGPQIIGHENSARGRLRGIAMRYRDHEGTPHFQWVGY